MITAKFYKKIPKRIINQCPDVMVEHTNDISRESGEDVNWFSFVNEAGEDVGCIQMSWDRFDYVNGMPAWTVFIYLFEVCKNFRGQGYAKEMVKWVESLPNVIAIELSHCTNDYGNSRRWWTHMGWKHKDKSSNMMSKKIR